MATRPRNRTIKKRPSANAKTSERPLPAGSWDRRAWLALFGINREDATRLRALKREGAVPAGRLAELLVEPLIRATSASAAPLSALPTAAAASSSRTRAPEGLLDALGRIFDSLFDARFDEDYFAARRSIGLDHEEMGLTPRALVAAYSRFAEEGISRILKARAGDPDRLAGLLGTFSKIILLDIGLAMEGYLGRSLEAMNEHSRQLERTVVERTHDLAVSERKYRQVVENARDIIWAMDFRGRVTLLNKGICGYSKDLLLRQGRKVLDALHTPESLEVFDRALATVRRTRKGLENLPSTYVNPFTEAQEHYLSNLQPVLDRRSRVAGVQGISHDVTQLKRLEEDLRRSEERYREVIESAPEMIHQVDAGRRFLIVNRAELRKLGYALEEMSRMRLEDVVPPEMREGLLAHFRRVVEKGRGTHQTVLLTRTGERIEVDMNDMALPGAGGEFIGLVSLVQDVSERKALEWQMLRAERLAAIGELTASFAHEVGTPLNVILSRAEYLMGGLELVDPNRKSLEVIASQIDRIKGTLSRLLEFSRGYEPKLERAVEVRKILGDVVEMLEHELERKGIGIHVEVEPGLPGIVADPHQLAQVFMNLFMNSIQAIPGKGEIVVRATFLGEQSFLRAGVLITVPLVRISVADTGVGIPRENVTKIFTPFFSTRERGRGTGLGLCVVDRIVRNHGGIVSVQSEVGKGSAFSVDLPVEGPEGSGAADTVRG